MESIAIEVLAKMKMGGTKEFQSKRKGVLVRCISRYLSFEVIKFVWNVVGDD